jgi:outer membrane receptor protein involved in Fe transport
MPGFSIRGLGVGDNATRGLLLIDQRPANGAYFGNVWWFRVPVQNTDRVEVIRGGSFGLFGSYAMAGTIHFRTRPTPTVPTLWAETKGGSLGTFEADVFGGGALAPGVRAAGGVNYMRTSGYIALPEASRGPIDRAAGVDAISARAAVDIDLSSSTTLGFHGDYMHDERTGSTQLSPKVTDLFSGGLTFKWYLASGNQLALSADYLREDFTTDNTSLVVFGDRSAEYLSNRHVTPADDYQASAVFSTPAGDRVQFTLGGDARLVSGEDSSDIYTANGFAFTRIGKGKQRSLGLFGQMRWTPVPTVDLSAALRADFFSNTDGSIVDTIAQTYPDRSFNELSPRLGLRWAVVKLSDGDIALRAAGYRSFRAPNLSNLYRSFGTVTFVGLANPNLDPETMTGGDAGVDLNVGRLAFQVNGFWTEVKNFIGDVVVGFEPFTVQRMNVGILRSRGVELIGSAALPDEWSIEAGFAYTDASIVESSDPELVGNFGEGAPEGVLTAAVGRSPQSGIGFQVRVRRLSSQYQDISNELFLPEHFVIDASASYASPGGWEVFVEGRNILDEEYIAEAESGALGTPLQVLGGVRIRLGGH